MSNHSILPAAFPRLFLLASVVACGADGPVEPVVSLVAISPTSLQGEVGAAIDPLPSVRVVDARGQPRAGVTVQFAPSAGVVGLREAVTNADGVATPGSWVLGTRVGAQTLLAALDGQSVSFKVDARPAPPAAVGLQWSGREVGIAGEENGGLLIAFVNDRFENRLVGVAVEFTVTEGDGQISGVTSRVVSTDFLGFATAGQWAFGTPGRHTVEARVDGLEPASITARVVDAGSIAWFARTSPLGGMTLIYHDIGLFDLEPCRDEPQTGPIIERALYQYHDYYYGYSGDFGFRYWGTYAVGASTDGTAPVTITWSPRSIENPFMKRQIQGTLRGGTTLEFSSEAGWPWEDATFALPDAAACSTEP